MSEESIESVRPETDSANYSPDMLSNPKKGKGVRRLNKRPLLIVGGLALLAVTGVSYTFYQRSNAGQLKLAQATHPAFQNTAHPPVKPDGDMLTPPVPPVEQVLPTPVEEKSVEVPAIVEAAPVSVEPDPDFERRRLYNQQIEDHRLSKWAEALESDGKVQLNSNQTQHNANTSEPATADASGGGQNAAYADTTEPGRSRSGGPGDGNSMVAENRQSEKRAFLSGTPEANTYLQHQRTKAVAPSQEIKAGTVIPGVMISGINSDLPGTIIAQVRQDVYDSATGGNLLIPAGAKLIGTYDSSVTLGQQRALVVWQRVIYPDSSSLSLDNMPGTDMGGYAGFNDKVNNHYWRTFGNGLLLSAFSAAIQLSQPQASNGDNYSSSQIIAGSLGQQMGELGMQMAQRNMNIQPTLEIRPGYRFNVMVTKDIILPPWQGHPLAGGQG